MFPYFWVTSDASLIGAIFSDENAEIKEASSPAPCKDLLPLWPPNAKLEQILNKRKAFSCDVIQKRSSPFFLTILNTAMVEKVNNKTHTVTEILPVATVITNN